MHLLSVSIRLSLFRYFQPPSVSSLETHSYSSGLDPSSLSLFLYLLLVSALHLSLFFFHTSPSVSLFFSVLLSIALFLRFLILFLPIVLFFSYIILLDRPLFSSFPFSFCLARFSSLVWIPFVSTLPRFSSPTLGCLLAIAGHAIGTLEAFETKRPETSTDRRVSCIAGSRARPRATFSPEVGIYICFP